MFNLNLKIIRLFVLLTVLIIYPEWSSAQVIEEWRATYSGLYGGDFVKSMCIDSYGNVYVTGESQRSQYIYDYATVKFNKWGGNLIWAARYNWPGDTMGGATAYSIALDKNDNVYVTGTAPVTISGLRGKITTVKYDSSGSQKWVAIFYDELYQAFPAGRVSIAVSNSFHIYVAGSACFTNGYNYTLIKYDSSGVQQWVAKYHGPGTQVDAVNQPSCIVLDDKENIYVSGVSTGDTTYNDIATIKFDSSGTQKWVARYNGPANLGDSATGIKVDNSGNVYVTGVACRRIYQFGARYDYVTIKYDSSGNQKWESLYRGDTSSYSNNFSNSIAVDNWGNVYVTGESRKANEYEDCATVKYDSSGARKWVAFYDFDHNPDWGVALVLDNLGYVYVAANSYQGIRPHFATIKYSPTGEQLWCMRTYSVNGESPVAIAVDNLRNVYVSGSGNGDYLTIKYNQPTGIQPVSNKIPDTYRLEQNFPNPFNPETNIRLALPTRSFVKLVVYDILGREVSILVNDQLNSGTYELNWNASNYPSGIYFYRLIAGEYSETKRMILLK